MLNFRLRGRLPFSALHFTACLFFSLLTFALPGPAARNAFAQPFRPGEVEFEGTLEVLHEDRDVGSRYLYFLQTAGERLSLYFAADPPEYPTGTRVRLRGLRLGSSVALQSGKSIQTK